DEPIGDPGRLGLPNTFLPRPGVGGVTKRSFLHRHGAIQLRREMGAGEDWRAEPRQRRLSAQYAADKRVHFRERPDVSVRTAKGDRNVTPLLRHETIRLLVTVQRVGEVRRAVYEKDRAAHVAEVLAW